ncbi:MAG TPA: class I SAM-dependent methyltransferase [Candidatus Edwardsbacteria bacterium]|nr:class I SAM-dependent methyltransferase [Candidatus Edwardsbacteria bacterium]
MKPRANYIGHDAQYQKYRAAGLNGWNGEADWLAWKRQLETLCRDQDFPKAGGLLELGCGAGEVALFFAERGYQVHGIDIAPTAICWAMEKATASGSTAQFHVGDVTDLRCYPAASFDIVIDGHCLHCIIGEDRRKVLLETKRVLKPGGFLYISTMCGDVKDPEMKPLFDPQSRCILSRDGTVAARYVGLPEDIVNEVKSAGFTIISQQVNDSDDYLSQDLIVHAIKPALIR